MGTTKTYGLGGGVAGTSEVDDNTDASVLIESSDGKDYIEIDTTDGSELLILKAGGSADQQVEILSAVILERKLAMPGRAELPLLRRTAAVLCFFRLAAVTTA